MYEQYWKLNEKPFNNTPDPRFLYQAAQYRDALMKLTYAVSEGMGSAMLTGVFGCGKTIMARAIRHQLGAERYRFAFVNNPQVSPVELLRAVVRNLKATHLADHMSELMADSLLEALQQVLWDNVRDGRETVVLIDEAHTVEDEKSFEQLRMLLNFQAEDRFLLTLLLVGQPELTDKVGNLKQLDQRIGIRCHLKQLTASETAEYIEHRLKVAGREEQVFTKDAVSEIFERSAGIPRRINHLCDMSLLTAFGRQAKEIDDETITATAEQFSQ